MFNIMGLTGRQRNTLEQFYTNKSIARNCLKTLNYFCPLTQYEALVEPSAGLGVFLDEIGVYQLSQKPYACDIIENSNRDDIWTQDFLSLSQETITSWAKSKTLVFGNPPFGRQSSLVRKFITQSARFADTIAFILPRSFLKPSLHRSYPEYFHQVYSEELPSDCFHLSNGKRHHVPCVFQIWKKKSTPRAKPMVYQPCHYYQFTSSPQEADASFRRVGMYAGQVSRHTEGKSPSSHYFIQLSFEVLPEQKLKILDRLGDYSWKSDRTVGPKSVSKQELVPVLNQIFTDIYGTDE